MNTVRSTRKFSGHKRENNNTEDLSCLRLSKTARKANNAGSSKVEVKTVMDLVDYISQLPDDILVNIVSQLTVKEAARTSVLSSRWIHLWRFFSGSLKFDDSWISKSIPDKQCRFVDQVTKVLQSLWSPSLEEFNVCFRLNTPTYKSNIDSWVEFAMKTKVKRFYMNLKSMVYREKAYNFPLQSLGSSVCIFLTALRLEHVDVTGQVIEHILSKCPLLEDLCVKFASCLGNLKISGPSLKLKKLKLRNNNVKNIEISAINLVSFKYYGKKTSVIFKDVPSLSVVSFGKPYTTYLMKTNLSNLSKIASQLEMLALDFDYNLPRGLDNPENFSRTRRFRHEYATRQVYMNSLNFPNFNNIKQLQLAIEDSAVLAMIEAFPSLHTLSVQLKMGYYYFGTMSWGTQHQCLRVVEIVGFVGRTCDVELAKYLFEYARLLEKIIIDSSYPGWIVSSSEEEERLKEARSCVQELERTKPIGATLVIR